MAIARDLVEEAQLAKLFGLANVDELMAELLLPEDAENHTYSHLKTTVTSMTGPHIPAPSHATLTHANSEDRPATQSEKNGQIDRTRPATSTPSSNAPLLSCLIAPMPMPIYPSVCMQNHNTTTTTNVMTGPLPHLLPMNLLGLQVASPFHHSPAPPGSQ